jgi:hypothetical protein
MNKPTLIKQRLANNHPILTSSRWPGPEAYIGPRAKESHTLRAQPNSDATQMERAIMIAKKRAEMPVMVSRPHQNQPRLLLFSDDQIIEN